MLTRALTWAARPGGGLDDGILPREDEEEGALAGLGDAGGHAGLDGGGAGFAGGGLDLEVDGGGDGGEVEEGLACGGDEEVISLPEEDLPHGAVVADDGEDEISLGGDFGEVLRGVAAELAGEVDRDFAMEIVDGGDVEPLFGEAAGHVRAHPTDADDGDLVAGRGRDSHEAGLAWYSGKNGLWCFSVPMVVRGPWPGATTV